MYIVPYDRAQLYSANMSLPSPVYVGYPESQSEWNSLFASMLMSRNVDEEVNNLLQSTKDLFSEFCRDLDHAREFCASDLKAVLDTAHLISVHEILEMKPANQEKLHVTIRKQHIVDAFSRTTRSSLLPADKLKFKRFFRPFMADDLNTGDPEWIAEQSVTYSDKETAFSDVKLKTSLR